MWCRQQSWCGTQMPIQILRQRKIDVRRTVTRNMTQFKGWLNANGRKESTVRLYLYQIHTLYKEAEKEAIAPHLPLLDGIKLPLPFKQKCELLTEEELRRMRYADLSDSMSQTFARDMFFFSIYCRGISFTDLGHIRKSDIKGFTLTYTSQVLPPPPIVTVQWDTAMQAIADRYPSTTVSISYYQIRWQDSGKSRNWKGSWKYHKGIKTNCYTLQSVRSTLLENDQGYLSACDWQCKCEQNNLGF